MNEEKWKEIIKEAGMEKAPDSLIDSIMAEVEVAAEKKPYRLPTPYFLGAMIVFFVFIILWTLTSGSDSGLSMTPLKEKLSFDLPQFELGMLLNNSILMYASIGLLFFVIIEGIKSLQNKVHYSA